MWFQSSVVTLIPLFSHTWPALRGSEGVFVCIPIKGVALVVNLLMCMECLGTALVSSQPRSEWNNSGPWGSCSGWESLLLYKWPQATWMTILCDNTWQERLSQHNNSQPRGCHWTQEDAALDQRAINNHPSPTLGIQSCLLIWGGFIMLCLFIFFTLLGFLKDNIEESR